MTEKDPYEPRLHRASGHWCKKIDGKVHYLGTDYKRARMKLARLIKGAGGGNREWLDAPVGDLVLKFLADLQARKSATTYRGYQVRLDRALKILEPDVRVGDLRRFHLAKIEQQMSAGYSPTTIKDTLAALQRILSWAVAQDYIESNLLLGYKKPAGRGRTRIVTPEEFRALLRASCPEFRRVLVALRLTGCRPGEIRSLIWEWTDLEEGFWKLPRHKTVSQQRQPMPRLIPLPNAVWSLCRWLAREPHAASDHVFLNVHGKPYSKDRFVKSMARARIKAKIEVKAGENIVMYSNRHTFGTESLGAVSDTELAELMGHTDVRTTRRYLHLDAQRLRAIRQRLSDRGA